MRWSKWKDVKLADVATIERAKAGKVYPFGCSLIPLSAWQIESISFLEQPTEVSGRYAVIIPNITKVLPRYLFMSIQDSAEQFEARYVTGINLQHDILVQYFMVKVHEDFECIEAIENRLEAIDLMQAQEARVVNCLQGLKAGMLEKMFV